MLVCDKMLFNYVLIFSGLLDDIYMYMFVVKGEIKRLILIIGCDVNGLV